MGIERMYLNIIKGIYDKSVANIILSGEKLNLFPKIKNKTKMSTLAPLIQHSIGSPSQKN